MDSLPPLIQPTHQYEMRRSDLFLGQLNILLHNRLIIGLVLFFAAFIAITSFAGLDSKQIPLVVRLLTTVIVLALAFVILCVAQLIFTAIIVFAKAHQGVVGNHTLVITDEGLIERTEFNDSLHRWKGFHRIRETRGYIYLYVSEVMYHQVPKRSFSSPNAMKEFFEEIRRRANLRAK